MGPGSNRSSWPCVYSASLKGRSAAHAVQQCPAYQLSCRGPHPQTHPPCSASSWRVSLRRAGLARSDTFLSLSERARLLKACRQEPRRRGQSGREGLAMQAGVMTMGWCLG